MEEALISIIITVYNGERFLAEAIQSACDQTYSNLEIIVVNDGSTDASADIAAGFNDPRVRCLHQENQGLSAARNHGIRSAQGKFFAFLDADDTWSVNKLALQAKALNDDPELDMVFGQVVQFFDRGKDRDSSDRETWKERKNQAHPEEESPDGRKRLEPGSAQSLYSNIMPGYSAGTMLIKRDAFFRVGMFDNQWKVGQFVDWYTRAREKRLKSLLLPEIVMRRRIHSSNMGIYERKSQTDYLCILKKALDRRRLPKSG